MMVTLRSSTPLRGRPRYLSRLPFLGCWRAFSRSASSCCVIDPGSSSTEPKDHCPLPRQITFSLCLTCKGASASSSVNAALVHPKPASRRAFDSRPGTRASLGSDASPLLDVDQVVVRVAVDELVVGVDAGAGGRLVHDDLEGLAGLGEPFFLEIQRLFFVLSCR